MINTVKLLKTPAPVRPHVLRPQVVITRNRRGFVECQDGRWLHLPKGANVQVRRQNKPKARRRLWQWIASVLNKANKEYTAWGPSINSKR